MLGPKATYAAESYLLGLFQLYPTVYFHKTTRGAEKMFSEILIRTFSLARDGKVDQTGLPERHPLVLFAKDPEAIENILRLDDTSVWGALSMMTDAKDKVIAEFAARLRDRQLFKCGDVRESVSSALGVEAPASQVNAIALTVLERVEKWVLDTKEDRPRILIDQAKREPYKQFQESKGPLNQIMLKTGSGALVDVSKLSKVVAAIETFSAYRVYYERGDNEAQKAVENIIAEEVKRANG